MARASKRQVICVDNEGFKASLEVRKVYVARPDAAAERRDHVRVIDESGEDYLYPKQMFVALDLPDTVRRAVVQAG